MIKSVSVGDKVILVDSYKNLEVDKTYEVARITEEFVVIRDVGTKVAIASFDYDEFKKYFIPINKDKRSWTKWIDVLDTDTLKLWGFYRTNGKKVQFKTLKGTKGEATCNKTDEFDLSIGFFIAVTRARIKEIDIQFDSLLVEQKTLFNSISELVKTVKPVKSTN